MSKRFWLQKMGAGNVKLAVEHFGEEVKFAQMPRSMLVVSPFIVNFVVKYLQPG